MGELKIEGVTHWSIPVNNLDESEKFYGDIVGLEPLGRLGNGLISCFSAGGDNRVLLCQRPTPADDTPTRDRGVHHSFTVSPETLVQACKLFQKMEVDVDVLVYRPQGFFTGRELYFLDPSGNRLELRDPTWKKGMPEPSFDELAEA